jgi:hypothetical protein
MEQDGKSFDLYPAVTTIPPKTPSKELALPCCLQGNH